MFEWKHFLSLMVDTTLVLYNPTFLFSMDVEADDIHHFVTLYNKHLDPVEYLVVEVWQDGCVLVGTNKDPQEQLDFQTQVVPKLKAMPILPTSSFSQNCCVIPQRELRGFKSFRDALYPENRKKVCYWSTFQELVQYAPLCPPAELLADRPDLANLVTNANQAVFENEKTQ